MYGSVFGGLRIQLTIKFTSDGRLVDMSRLRASFGRHELARESAASLDNSF